MQNDIIQCEIRKLIFVFMIDPVMAVKMKPASTASLYKAIDLLVAAYFLIISANQRAQTYWAIPVTEGEINPLFKTGQIQSICFPGIDAKKNHNMVKSIVVCQAEDLIQNYIGTSRPWLKK